MMEKENIETTIKEIKVGFKLGDNFDNFMYDMLIEKINKLEYIEALNILTTIGISEKEAIGVLFGDYEIANTESEVMVVDSLDNSNKLNLYKPLNLFISDYESTYRTILEVTSNIILRKKDVFINIYNTDDKDLPVLTKYFPFPIKLIFDPGSGGDITVNIVKFFNTLCTSIDNGDIEDLLDALDVSWSRDNLSSQFEYFYESKKILDLWKKVKNCISFITKYRRNYKKTFDCLNRLSGIEEAFEKKYSLILNENIIYYDSKYYY